MRILPALLRPRTAHPSRARRSRSEFPTTLTELNAIAALAITGLNMIPNAG